MEDMRRVENVVIEEMGVTRDIVKGETEVGIRRCGKWRLGKTRPKLRVPRKRSRPGYCAGGDTPDPLLARRRCAVCGDQGPTHLEALEALRLAPEPVSTEAVLYQD